MPREADAIVEVIRSNPLLEDGVRARLDDPICENVRDAATHTEAVCVEFVEAGGRIAEELLHASGLPPGSDPVDFPTKVDWDEVGAASWDAYGPEDW